jgi:hypothetical protein
MKKVAVTIVLTFILCVVLVQSGSAFAAESGIGHYFPGALADFGDMAPPSGFALMSWYNNYSGSVGASKQLEFGGLVAANVSATSNAEMLGAVYTSPYGILGGKFAVGVIVPYIWADVTGTITGTITLPIIGTRTRTFTRSDSADGIGDITLMPFWLNWTCGDFKWAVLLDVYAPTGAYNTGQLANVGLNYWTFEPVAQFSWISKKIGLEISANAGFDFNTDNDATDYQSGDVFHLDTTIAEHLPFFGCGIIGVGANAFYWKQFTADSGSGAKLGSFETLMTGVGPVLSYISPPICGHTLVAEVKWLPQTDTHYTLSGNYVWFKVGLAF